MSAALNDTLKNLDLFGLLCRSFVVDSKHAKIFHEIVDKNGFVYVFQLTSDDAKLSCVICDRNNL
jgi:hypothetical protein